MRLRLRALSALESDGYEAKGESGREGVEGRGGGQKDRAKARELAKRDAGGQGTEQRSRELGGRAGK